MKEIKKVGVVGAGSWGTAVANVFAHGSAESRIWGRDASQLTRIANEHENKKYLPGLKLSEDLGVGESLSGLIDWADLIVCSIPAQRIRDVFTDKSEALAGKYILNTSKGIEQGTGLAVSEIFQQISPSSPYAVLSGPNFAKEVVQCLPAATTVASKDEALGQQIQRLTSTSYFRAYTSSDVIGVEYAGSLKNVIAIATGIAVGLKLGYNAGAALINRGMAEMIRMGRKKGAKSMTFLGLAGTGDLFLTCGGPLSRNRSLGVAIGEGKTLEEARKELGGVAEGYYTTRSAYELAQKLNVEMPVTEQVYSMLYESKKPKEALAELMGRELKEEWDIGDR